MKTCWSQPRDQVGRRAHGRQIGADIDGVGDEQQRQQPVHDGQGHHLAHIVGQAPPGDPADQGADHLDGDHQREGQHHGPEQVEAELGPGLAVGGDAAGIVVGGAGDQARAQPLQQRRLMDTGFQAGGQSRRRRPDFPSYRFGWRGAGRVEG